MRYAPQSTRIRWKQGKDLSRKYPAETEDGDVTELGTFFNWFTVPSDPFDVSSLHCTTSLVTDVSKL